MGIGVWNVFIAGLRHIGGKPSQLEQETGVTVTGAAHFTLKFIEGQALKDLRTKAIVSRAAFDTEAELKWPDTDPLGFVDLSPEVRTKMYEGFKAMGSTEVDDMAELA